MTDFRPKDYILAEGFYAAVVSYELENNRVLTTVRYHQDESEDFIKFNTQQANDFLKQYKPDYLFQSRKFDVLLHGIPLDEIERVFLPNESYTFLKSLPVPDVKQIQTIELLEFFNNSGIESSLIGVTGSVLIGFQNDTSDIDLVFYGRNNFYKARAFVKEALDKDLFHLLDMASWENSYDRRDSSISFDEYLFHEQRKLNKFLYNETKVDISLVLNQDELVLEQGPFTKESPIVLKARVIDDSKSFDLPARYYLDNTEFNEVVCYTATYTGQAVQGEVIEISGVIEVNSVGDKRIIVGTSREAENEYIKVIGHE